MIIQKKNLAKFGYILDMKVGGEKIKIVFSLKFGEFESSFSNEKSSRS
jgi:hypothetical protein